MSRNPPRFVIPYDELPAVRNGLLQKLPPRSAHLARAVAAHVRLAGGEISALRAACFAWLRRNWIWYAAAQVAFLLGGWTAVARYDEAWRHAARSALLEHREALQSLAGQFSYWGDFVSFNLALVGVFWVAAGLRRAVFLRRIAMALLLSSVLAGAVANVARFSLGRARPNANAPDALYGPRFEGEYHALPSAHTSTAFGAAIPLAIAMPQAGVPALAVASGVAWSRLYRNQHRPTDILCGIWLATLIGVPLGLAARRAMARRPACERCVHPSRSGAAGTLPLWTP